MNANKTKKLLKPGRVILLLIAASLFAQELVIKTDVRLVVVNVSVRDRAGNLVTDLKKEDFELLEDNVKQKIQIFELQNLNNELLTPASFANSNAPRTVEEKAAAKPAATAPAPAAAKTGPIRYQDRRLLALFFDMTSMQPADQMRARESAIKFLESQMTASDLVSIMTFANKLKVVEEFTDDRERLIATLRKMALGEGSELADVAATGSEEGDDSGGFTADDTEFNIFNTDRKLSALEDAAKKLSIYPEKKALVYFSSGVSKTGVENESQLKATVNAAVRANVSFYPVDARGLSATPPGGDASTASPRGTSVFSGGRQASTRGSMYSSQESLSTLAADTGGKALLDNNDLSMGIRQAQSDINSYYIIGYYSTNDKLDGKYRRLSVRVASQPQAKLDYRNGYYAGKEFKQFTSADKERQLEEALTLGDPVSEIPLALEVDYFRVARDRYFVPITVKLPAGAVGFTKKGSKQQANIDFIGQVRDEKGKLISGIRDEIVVKVGELDLEKIAKHNIQYDGGLTLAPGKYNLRFLARENASGKMGTFETGFVVPDLAGGKNLRVSSVILGSQRESVSAAVGTADSSKKLQAGHPLVSDGQKLLPSITRVFRKDQTLYVYFEVYDPTLDTGKVPSVSAEVSLLLGGRKAFSSAPVRLTKLATSRPGVAPFSFQIPLAKLQPGQYVSQVNVIDETGRKFAFPRNSLVLLP